MLKPSKKQLMYQDLEQGVFFHFGIRTFNEGHRDWDGKAMDIHTFNPIELDCEQWIKTVKEAGFNYAIMTTKHHDGFNLWPSKYTDYSVANCNWRDGKGDVVKEFVDACRKYDIKVGLYYSPADFGMFEKNMSEKEYNDYILNQLTELMSNYGDIDLVWFDACGSDRCTYYWNNIMNKIRSLQKNILIFNLGDPDFRWIGNEAGIATNPCWNVLGDEDYPVEAQATEYLCDSGIKWIPAECDCRLRRRNWFYSDFDEDTIKSVDELMGLYYYSVGRGANLLINIGPDRRGLLPEKDGQRLVEFGDEIKQRFSEPIATIKDISTEQDIYTYRCEEGKLINHVVIKEDLREGEKVRKFKITGIPYNANQKIVFYEGYNIGHKAICSFPTVGLKELNVEIVKSSGEVVLKDISLYYCK